MRKLSEALARICGKLRITNDVLTPKYTCPIRKDTI